MGDAHYLTCPTLRYPAPSLIGVSHRINRRLADAAAAGLTVREAVASWSRERPVPP
jgi:hypothetical protein